MPTSLQLPSSLVEGLISNPHLTFSSYWDDHFYMNGSIYVDSQHHLGNLEHKTKLSITLKINSW